MNLNKLWTKLFSERTEEEEIGLHSAGATVRHRNPFEYLEVPRSDEMFTKEFVQKWVVPFYMSSFNSLDDGTIKTFAAASDEIDKDIILQLLSCFDWRIRITAGYFSAINQYTEYEDIIGRHLLKSEVCYAGFGYCLALATFGGKNAIQYLVTYLEYYLERKDLGFEQETAFLALEYLDKNASDKLMSKLNAFMADKPYWNLENSRMNFSTCMAGLEKIRKAKNK